MVVQVKRNDSREAATFESSLSAFYACLRVGNVEDPALFNFIALYKPLYDPVAEFIFKNRMKKLSDLLYKFDAKNREKAAKIAEREVSASSLVSRARKEVKAGREPERARDPQDIWTFNGRNVRRGWAIFRDLSKFVEVE